MMADTLSRISGVINAFKPEGVSSRFVVDRIGQQLRQLTGGPVRCGHAGTLDPLATGVLIVASGRATRLIRFLQQQRKTYRAEITLGCESDTDDRTGQVTTRQVVSPPGRQEIESVLEGFSGTIQQRPPAWSALKVSGRRAYQLAREGQIVDLQERPVEIHRLVIQRCEFPQLELEIECGSGTYIRSIARDLGEQLGCGGMLNALQRTAIGPWRVEDAITIGAEEGGEPPLIQSAVSVFPGLPTVHLKTDNLLRLRDGKRIIVPGYGGQSLVAVDQRAEFLALLEPLHGPGDWYKAEVNWVPSIMAEQKGAAVLRGC